MQHLVYNYTFRIRTIQRVVLDGCLSRAQQYWFVKQSASLGSLGGWWTGVLGTANTVYSALSGILRSIGDCARMEAFADTGESRCFILPSLVLSYKTFLFAPRMLRYFSMPHSIGLSLPRCVIEP